MEGTGTGEEEVSFITRRPARPYASKRPHSIGSTIISNPKLVKGWQYYDNSPNQRDIQKYFSTVHLGASTSETFLSQPDTSSSAGGTGKRSVTSHATEGPIDNLEDPEDSNPAAVELVTGEVKAVVSPHEQKDCCKSLVRVTTPILGIMLAVISTMCLSLRTTFLETLPSFQYHPYSVLVWTSQGLFWPSFVLLLCPCQMRSVRLTKPELPPWRSNSKPFIIFLLVLRAFIGWVGPLLYLHSLEYTSREDATFFRWTSPVFVLMLAWLFLKERPGLIPAFTVILAVGGVVLLVQPPLLTGNIQFQKYLLIGYALALSATMLEGVLNLIILRHLRHVHFALITLLYGGVGTLGGVLLYFIYPDRFKLPADSKDTFLALIACVLTFLGETGLFGALKYEQAGLISVVRTWQLPMLLGWRFYFLHIATFTWKSWLGVLLIFLAILVLIGRKLVYGRSRTCRTRRLLGFLLL